MAKIFTNVSGATWWLNFQQMHVVTLADDDMKSILTGDANKEISSKMTMHVAPPGGQISY